MGRDVAERHDWARELWELAEKESGLALREIYWEGEAADMADTRALQPALTVADMSLYLAARDRLSPMGVAGHSLGEYPALFAAGVLGEQDVLRAVCLRGRLMAECGAPKEPAQTGEESGHGMAAVVKLPRERVEELVAAAAASAGGVLVVANYNAPAQTVVSGEAAPLAALAEAVKAAKGRAIPLAVSGAFHSPLIREAADEFAALLRGLSWSAPSVPVFFDATARPEADPARILEIMATQMTSSVRWVEIMAGLYEAGARTFVELGPGNVLAKLAGQNLNGRDGVNALSVGSLEGLEAL
jgi:[acyl-carrier-protein] S-malonyltransferase